MRILAITRDWPCRWQTLIRYLATSEGIELSLLTSSEAPEGPGLPEPVYRFAPAVYPVERIHGLLAKHVFLTRETEAIYNKVCEAELEAPDIVLQFAGQGAGFLLKHRWPEVKLVLGIGRFPVWQRERRFDRPDVSRNLQLKVAQRLNTPFPLLEIMHCHRAFVFSHAQYQQIPAEWKSKTRIVDEPVESDSMGEMGRLEVGSTPSITVSGASSQPDGDILGRQIRALHALASTAGLRPRFTILGTTPSRTAASQRLNGDGIEVRLLPSADPEQARPLWQKATLHISFCGPASEDPHLLACMAAGTPVCASDNPYGREFVQHRRNGLLISFHNPNAAAAECVAALGDPETRRRLAVAAQETVKERHSPQLAIAQIRDLLANLV